MFRTPIFAICRLRMGIDGQGVTTLVTFMGCPLTCKYCLNDICHEPIYEVDGQTLRRDIMMLTPEELYDRVKEDNVYFQATGGGICFGGGEPGLRADFIAAFKNLCPPQWRITLETCLYYDDNTLKKLASVVDYWIVDIKEMDPEIYQTYTGRVCNNLQYLRSLRQEVDVEKVIIKVPHIPHFNIPANVEKSIVAVRNLGFNHIIEHQYLTPKEYDQRKRKM